MSSRIILDRQRCEGHGMCEDAAPEVFSLDDEGELHVLISEVPPALERDAQAAVRVCPVAALSLRPS